MAAESVNAFISRWANASPSERANSQLFLSELCDLLDVAHPDPSRDNGYGFEFSVTHHHADGSTSTGRIDLYKRGCFVLESKQFQAAKAKASELDLARPQCRSRNARILSAGSGHRRLGRRHDQSARPSRTLRPFPSGFRTKSS